MITLLLATHNSHKAAEVRTILGAEKFNILTLDDCGITEEPEEDGLTFQDNALIKAQAALKYTSYGIIADDSGLCVDALKGAPGVKSKRFSVEGTDESNNQLLLKSLEHLTNLSDRSAHYITSICYISPERNIHFFEGRCDGNIGFALKGHNGFGYDPLFIASEVQKTFAECNMIEKDAISHRGKAFNALKDFLEN